MNTRALVAAVLFTSAACTRIATAEPLETSFAVTINPLDGEHIVTGGGVSRIAFAPLPLGELNVRANRESIRIEGLPPVTLRYGGDLGGAQSTSLSVASAVYRHTFAGGWFAGFGQTLYNQSTTYAGAHGLYVYTRGNLYERILGSEIQYSRVTGPHFEIGRIVRGKSTTLELWISANPRMHGVQYTQIPTGTTVSTFSDPETAAQVDMSARIARRLGKHAEVLFGLRYIDYSAHYDDIPGQLADRNLGFAPVIGYRVRL